MRMNPLRAILLLVALAACGSALAQAWPSRPIRIIIGFPPGSGGETQVRLVGQKLTEAWGQPIVVDSRPGASGNIATELLVKSAADGYTLQYFPAALAINPSLYPQVPYDLKKDFSPIALLGTFPLVLVVHPGVTAKSVAELIALAKARSGAINYASIGSASPPHLAGELFNQLAGVNLIHVPYKGSAPAQTDLIGGQVQLMFDTAVSAIPHVKAGRTRALAVTTRNRSHLLPELPSLEESGLKGFDLYGWGGIVAPAGVAADIVAKLNSEISKALRQPDVAEKLAALGAEPGSMGAREFGRFILDEAAKWKKLVVSTGAKLD
ncbi:MAG: tripartite tricarboxylate transporter substrate binding protein [Betaproteobacteria bacterium]|nr:tripartite tricarboxylate transporter substrate binding protein [Betaproteobacteria bacterium]